MQKHIALFGGSGVIGTILRKKLNYGFIVVDKVRPKDSTNIVNFFEGSVTDEKIVRNALNGSFLAIHLATGAPNWDTLLETDMLGLKCICETSLRMNIDKVIYASTNHVVGMVEKDFYKIGAHKICNITDPVRPDSYYGVAKIFGEALCRFYAETTHLKTSCIRFGTVRLEDNLEMCANEPYFSYIPGGREAILSRLAKTWQYHDDLAMMMQEEIDSQDKFRLRFGISENEDPFWSSEVYRWRSVF